MYALISRAHAHFVLSAKSSHAQNPLPIYHSISTEKCSSVFTTLLAQIHTHTQAYTESNSSCTAWEIHCELNAYPNSRATDFGYCSASALVSAQLSSQLSTRRWLRWPLRLWQQRIRIGCSSQWNCSIFVAISRLNFQNTNERSAAVGGGKATEREREGESKKERESVSVCMYLCAWLVSFCAVGGWWVVRLVGRAIYWWRRRRRRRRCRCYYCCCCCCRCRRRWLTVLMCLLLWHKIMFYFI